MRKKIFTLFYIISVLCSTNLFAEDTDLSDLKVLIPYEKIQNETKNIAKKIDQLYRDQEIVILMIMKGSFIFVSDLVREIKTPCTIETITCSSYGQNGIV